MKNRIYLLITLLAFLLIAVAYSNGFFRFGETGSQSEIVSSDSMASSMVRSENSGTPSAENVASSYYQTVTELEGYLSSHPTDTTHVLRLARLYHEGHQPEKASEWYEKYLELKPHDIQTHLDLANTYGESGLWDQALSVTEKLLVLEPENGEGLYNKAAILANQGNFEQAKIIWEQIVSLDIDSGITEMAKNSIERLSNM